MILIFERLSFSKSPSPPPSPGVPGEGACSPAILQQPRVVHGTTLLEVLLGLAILATLLTSVVIARGRFMRQWADADRRSHLLAAADLLMNDLSRSQPAQLLTASGSLADPPSTQWRTRLIDDPAAASVNACKFRLELIDTQHASSVVRVDFLVHNPRATTAPAGES